MTSLSDVLQAAQAIRPYLPELLTRHDAETMASRLDLAQQSTTDPAAQRQELLDILSTTDSTREWLRLYLEDQHEPAEILKIIRTYQPLPGKAGAVTSPRYRCPVASCHQTWYRREASAEIPNCPIHGVKLVRDSKIQADPGIRE